MEIKWSKVAVKQLLDIIQYLEENDSIIYAEKLEVKILSKINNLPQTANLYQIDRLKKSNDRSFFAVEINSYRISYRLLKKEIRILRIRHVYRRPFTR